MSVRDRVDSYRARMRARGLRPVQLWAVDMRTADFAIEARRQSRAIAVADAVSDDQDFVDAVAEIWTEE